MIWLNTGNEAAAQSYAVSQDRDILPPERRALSGTTFNQRYDYGCAIEKPWHEKKGKTVFMALVLIVTIFAIAAIYYARKTP